MTDISIFILCCVHALNFSKDENKPMDSQVTLFLLFSYNKQLLMCVCTTQIIMIRLKILIKVREFLLTEFKIKFIVNS